MPGGKPQDGEDALQTLTREVVEESQVTMLRPRYLGYQRVECDGEVFAQVRYTAVVDDLLPVRRTPPPGVPTGGCGCRHHW